jgi:hypothetical protein
MTKILSVAHVMTSMALTRSHWLATGTQGSLWGWLLRSAERENQVMRWPQMESGFSKCLQKQN